MKIVGKKNTQEQGMAEGERKKKIMCGKSM